MNTKNDTFLDDVNEKLKDVRNACDEIEKMIEEYVKRIHKKPQDRERQELIEAAKRYLENKKKYSFFHGDYYPYENIATRTHFIVNKEKRSVVCLLKGKSSGNVRSRGIAKCMEGDVFNVHLGKAIALARALGREEEASDFMNAPQPKEVGVGDIIRFDWIKYTEYKVISLDTSKSNLKIVTSDDFPRFVGNMALATTFDDAIIVDDSRE
ncbi:hypothetical protein M5X17_27890 [Paenibacillus alvei]|uniref:hypothetical protein n=1 Tax=Paenibacillus alvei TaxID=44250 RepID=UPI00227FE30E|nr:hypothetical protein [Paenibacillus alvei]MCY9737529.1 hypothetical protein [Paenibacillus alvei]